jgi:NAD(P)-dependent dehydrogenase (short-subunit alcohol dehydrogenase family)
MARISTPFTAESTAAEVVEGIDLTGRRVIVTGGASGIGIETARALAGAGAEVTLAVRDLDAGERTAEDIIATTGRHRRALLRGLQRGRPERAGHPPGGCRVRARPRGGRAALAGLGRHAEAVTRTGDRRGGLP